MKRDATEGSPPGSGRCASLRSCVKHCGTIESMQKSHVTAITVLAAGIMLLGNAVAQQAPAATPAAKSQSATTPTTKPASAAKTQPALTLKTQKDKVSYAIGMNLGK